MDGLEVGIVENRDGTLLVEIAEDGSMKGTSSLCHFKPFWISAQ